MSKVDWSLAPKGATHWVGGMHPWHKNIGTTVFYWSTCGGCWKKLTGFDVDQVNSQYLGVIQERPKQPKAWSGPEDGLPPIGVECEYGSDERGWQKINVLAHTMVGGVSAVGQVGDNGQICIGTVKYWRQIRTQKQLAAYKRETAIRELMDIAQVDCRVTAARLVDAGFKREACKSDCSTNNRGVPELLGACDCR